MTADVAVRPVACLLILVVVGACPAREAREPSAHPRLEAETELTTAFLKEHYPRYQVALRRARQWLDKLVVDPIDLRRRGLKGKKKLVEILEAYVHMYQAAATAERPGLLDRIRRLAATTSDDRYHDMLAVSDQVFKQDATSYLRAAVLMERVGLDTRRYRAEIGKIKARLDGHLAVRGAHQQMAFHWYYQHFGLREPFSLARGFDRGVIAKRTDPYRLRRSIDTYHLTHEVFIPYEYGERRDARFFSQGDLRYLRRALDRLTVHRIMMNDPDLVAELVTSMRFVGLTDLPVYREALVYLLDTQHPDGRWGNYERYRKRWGDLVNQGFYLHTTSVAVDALLYAYDYSWTHPGR